MQKFTRPLTREVEIAGSRLAFTFSEQGVSVRPVGLRRPPHEVSWGGLICHLTGRGSTASEADVAAAVEDVKRGAKSTSDTAAPPAGAAPMPSAERSRAEGQESPRVGGEASTLSSALAHLDAWLAKHRPAFHRGLRPAATFAQLASLQQALGMPVPGSLQALLAWHNGQSTDFVGHFEQSWDLMDADRIAEARRDLLADQRTTGWHETWVPFLEDDDGDYLFVDAGRPNAPVLASWQGKADHPQVAASLSGWLEDFAAAVERGDYQEDSERGSFLHRGK